MTEIFCRLGQKTVDLPDANAYNADHPFETIIPCEGCEHSIHLKKIKIIADAYKWTTFGGGKIKTTLEHTARVIDKGNGNNEVLCSCHCDYKFVPKKKEGG